MTEVCSAGFPHSEISGSKDICSSPKLIAAYHVFLRLLVPRHPPCALIAWPFAHHPSVGDAVFWFSLLILVCSHRLNRCLPILRFNVCIKDIWLNLNQIYMYAVFKVQSFNLTECLSVIRTYKLFYKFWSLVKPVTIKNLIYFLFLIRRPPALPHRLQCSTIGRLGLNRRVRDGNGCFP